MTVCSKTLKHPFFAKYTPQTRKQQKNGTSKVSRVLNECNGKQNAFIGEWNKRNDVHKRMPQQLKLKFEPLPLKTTPYECTGVVKKIFFFFSIKKDFARNLRLARGSWSQHRPLISGCLLSLYVFASFSDFSVLSLWHGKPRIFSVRIDFLKNRFSVFFLPLLRR